MEGPVHEWAGQALERLTAHGYRPVTPLLGDTGEVAVARRADFRAKWGLTKLHTCVLVREVDVATAEHVLSEGAIGGLVVPCASNPLLMRFGTRAAFRGDCRLRWPFCPSSCVGVRRRGGGVGGASTSSVSNNDLSPVNWMAASCRRAENGVPTDSC